MKTQSNKQGIVWGGLLILFGIMGLIELYGSVTTWIWIAVLAVAGLGTFVVYLSERSNWGLLIPTYVLWGIAGFIGLIELNVLNDAFIPTFVLTAVALPFIIGFLRNRELWGLLIPAYVLIAVGVMVWLLERGVLQDLMVPAYVMFAIAIPFFVVYGRNPRQWWPLIPGAIMAIVGLSFLIAEAMLGYVVPILLIAAGIFILVRQFIQREIPAKDPKGS